MPQQLESTVSTAKSGTRLSTASTAGITANDFWWQWPCSSARFATGWSGSLRVPAFASRAGNSPLEEGSNRSGTAFGLPPRLVDQPDGEKGASTAQRASAVRRFRHMHSIAGGGEHAQRRLDILRLEVAVERISEEDDRSRLCAGNARRLAPWIGTPARQAPPAAEAQISLRPLPQARRVVAHVGELGPLGRERRVARQVSDQAVVQRKAAFRHARRLHLDLHARHVDAGRAFAPARLAGDAELQGLRHVIRGQRVRSELTGDGEAQRVGAPARDVALVAGDAIARAHHTARQRAARAVVVAHLDRALETITDAGIGGPVEGGADILGAIVRTVAQQPAIVEFRRAHDLAGIVEALGVEPLLDRFEGAHQSRAEHLLVEFRTHDAVAVLARMGALVG